MNRVRNSRCGYNIYRLEFMEINTILLEGTIDYA